MTTIKLVVFSFGQINVKYFEKNKNYVKIIIDGSDIKWKNMMRVV